MRDAGRKLQFRRNRSAAALEWNEPRRTLGPLEGPVGCPLVSSLVSSLVRGSGELFMKFAAIIEYTSDADKIGRVRPVHREYILGLKQRGQMAIAGPFTDDSGGLLVYEAETQEEVENFIRQDPFFKKASFSPG